MRRRLIPVAIAACALVLAAAPTAPAARVISATPLSPRLTELEIATGAVPSPQHVRVLLPAGYATSHRRYPVLYLLHGATDDDTAWTTKGDATALTARLPLIVVMPSSGATGGYTNWVDRSSGRRDWETFHIDQLLPLIDARYRTVPSRAGRAIAGLSMGGFGAMSYAARHPDLFAAAASFSGAVDTNDPLDVGATGPAPFGPRATQAIRWHAHNPTDLAENLRGLTLVVRTGNGLPGGPFGGGDVVERAVYTMNKSFHHALNALSVPHVWDDYGPGGHLWPYWNRDLRETLPIFLRTFAHPRPAPRAVTFRAVEPRYAVFGWSVALRRRALELSALRRASASRGFTVCGSGTATVRTPPRADRAGRTVAVHVADARGHRRLAVRADGRGRLTVPVDLGPSNAVQQDRPGPARHVRAARVAFGAHAFPATRCPSLSV